MTRLVELSWCVHGRTITEKRATDLSNEKLVALIQSFDCREYRVSEVVVR